jgi:hypothetical protein
MRILAQICRRLGIAAAVQDHGIVFPDDSGDVPMSGAGKGGAEAGAREGAHPAAELFLLCWNSDYAYVRGLSCPAFHVIRDPRDIIVSAYFSHLHSHDDANWPRLRAFRPFLRGLDETQGLFAEMEFCALFLHHMLSWDYANPAIAELRFEDLIADPPARFGAALAHLGLVPARLPAAELAAILEANSFERLTGRRTGEEDVRRHFRKGVPGDWKNHFTPAHVARFKALYNPLLLKTGYETSDDWRL